MRILLQASSRQVAPMQLGKWALTTSLIIGGASHVVACGSDDANGANSDALVGDAGAMADGAGGDDSASQAEDDAQASAADDDAQGPAADDDAPDEGTTDNSALPDLVVEGENPIEIPVADDEQGAWLQHKTLSLRVGLPMAGHGQVLSAEHLATQLAGYDPGSLLRCTVSDDAKYQGAIETLGGVSWGYQVNRLVDQSTPLFYAGIQYQPQNFDDLAPQVGNADTAAAPAVEIVKPDIVAVTQSAALFYSQAHGLLVINLEGETPEFQCAAQLPGRVDQFFFHEGHLVAMTKGQNGADSFLLHFVVDGTEVSFLETINLGNINILDSRRFNNKLVLYTDHTLAPAADLASAEQQPDQGGGAPAPPTLVFQPQAQHRALRVFNFGDALEEELYDTLIDTSLEEQDLAIQPELADSPIGTVVNESRRFGYNMWASDHYFVVTEEISRTTLAGWGTRSWNVCLEGHSVTTPYQYCYTEYETRPNPDYLEPTNSGGDRACDGQTLSACLLKVARVSNRTIQVPVARTCEERARTRYVCDASETRSADYPIFENDFRTELYIYEYTPDGFIKLDTQVHEITTQGLENESADAQVDVLTTSTDTFDLAVPGAVQTLRFQNGYLYVISEGVLQTYAMGGSSIVRTSTLQVVNETLQSSLFSGEQLFLSDFGWAGGDHSTLRVINMSNPGFPIAGAATHELPGGHRSIIPSQHGIFTIGTVNSFMGQTVNAIKLGLFSDPYVDETAYLVLGTDLAGARLSVEEAQYFNGQSQRLLLPYQGNIEEEPLILDDGTAQRVLGPTEYRIGISRIEPGTLITEGAVVVPEPVQRVRPLKAEVESYLSFANSSVEWLRPDGDEWRTDAVLEYLQPFAVYRLTENDDYAELQRLGTRCRIYISNASNINQRQDGTYTEEFKCQGWPVAYDRRFLFGAMGVEFDDEGNVRILTEQELKDTRLAINNRPICLLSLELMANVSINPTDLPENPDLTCLTPVQYQELRAERIAAEPAP